MLATTSARDYLPVIEQVRLRSGQGGLSYDRQRAVAAETGSLQAVATSLVTELDDDTAMLATPQAT